MSREAKELHCVVHFRASSHSGLSDNVSSHGVGIIVGGQPEVHVEIEGEGFTRNGKLAKLQRLSKRDEPDTWALVVEFVEEFDLPPSVA